MSNVRPSQTGTHFCQKQSQGPTLPKARLTRAAVDQALAVWKPGQKLRLWFESPKGMGLLIRPSGSASYFLLFTKPDGSRSEITLAAENEVTPQIAAEIARQKIAQAQLTGVDPGAAKTGGA